MIIQGRERVLDDRASYCISRQDATLLNGVAEDGGVFFRCHSPEAISATNVKIRPENLREYYEVPKSHHPDTFTIRADPSRAVADAPLIFFKAVFTNHKSARTTPTKLLFLLAAVTYIFATPSFSIAFLAVFLIVHDTSCSTH